jgi:hypothetical protein
MTRARIVAMSFVLVVLVAGGVTIAVAGSGSAPGPTTKVSVRSSCIPPALTLFGSRPPLPKELSTPLEATILSSFAIFRRPARPSDEPPGLNLAAGGLRRELYKDYELSSYYPAYVRQPTGLTGSRRYFVVPAFARSEAVAPAHCFPAVERRELVEQDHRRSVEPVYCIIEVGGNKNAPVPGCESFAQTNASFRAFHVSDFLGQEPTVELVPDGVASVRTTYRDRVPIVVRVKEDAFLLTPPPAPHDRLDAYLRGLMSKVVGEHVTKTQQLTATKKWNKAFGGTYPIKIEWLDNAGGLVRALNPPTAESNSATSVGNLDAPLEVSESLKG